MEPRAPPLAAFAGASLIWGSTFLVIQRGNEAVAPFWGATLRLVIAGALLALVTVATGRRFPRGRHLRAAAWFGVLNMGVGLAFLYWGELLVPSGVASVLYATIPLTTFLLAASVGLERLRVVPVLGSVAAIGGVALVFAGELRADVPPIGLVSILVAATAAAVAGVVVKRAGVQDAIPLNATAAPFGVLVTFALAVGSGEALALPASWAAWWPILYLAVLGSMGAYVLWAWLLKVWPVSSANLVAVVVPVLAVLLGAVANAERPHAWTWAGAAVVVASVAAVIRAKR